MNKQTRPRENVLSMMVASDVLNNRMLVMRRAGLLLQYFLSCMLLLLLPSLVQETRLVVERENVNIAEREKC